jgi:hypothetical protein
MLGGDKPSAVYNKAHPEHVAVIREERDVPAGRFGSCSTASPQPTPAARQNHRVPLEPERRCPESSRSLPFLAQRGSDEDASFM